MRYVDGYVLPVPKKNLPAYRRMAQKAAGIWREHGALEYRECVGDDLEVKAAAAFGVTPFPRSLKLKRGETVIFSWIMFKSRAHRDRVNAKVMSDPRLAKMATPMPFDAKRMVYGGVWPGGKVSAFDGLYHDIVADQRIVYSHAMQLDDVRISVSLATVEFKPAGAGVRLIFTEQAAFLDGYDDAGSREHGTGALLDKLGAELQRAAAGA